MGKTIDKIITAFLISIVGIVILELLSLVVSSSVENYFSITDEREIHKKRIEILELQKSSEKIQIESEKKRIKMYESFEKDLK